MRYQDFVVRIGLLPEGRLRARVLRSPAGEGELTVPLPSWLEDAVLAHSSGIARGPEAGRDVRLRTPPPPAAVEVGRLLHELIFSGVVGRLWDQSRGSLAGRREAGLRLRLQLDLANADLLAELPWELLRSGDTGAYLSLDRRTPVLRHLEVAQPVSPQKLPASLKVLGVAAAPRELDSLDLATEKQKLEKGKKLHRWQLSYLAQPTVEQLREALVREGAQVLHFMGHGDFDPASQEGALYFEDGQGNASPWTGSQLAATLTGLPALRLVVLNACQTAVSGISGNAYGGVAAALVRGGIPAVIAMQRPISDGAAIAFSSAFYRHLASGADLEEALTEGRQAIRTANPSSLEWAIPVLFSRAMDDGLFWQERGNRALWLVAAAAALLGTSLVLQLRERPVEQQVERPAMPAELPIQGLKIDQVLATGIDGVLGRLLSVEILEDGTMRLHFEFENQGDQARVLGFDFPKTYLADEHGNAYEVRASSSPVPGAGSLTASVPAGESRRFWLEFSAPQDGAQRLHVELANPEKSEGQFVPFEVALPSYPKELSVPSPPAVRLPDSDALPLAITINNGRKDVISQVRRIEVAEQAMRVSVDLWNRSKLPLKAAFDPSKIELEDVFGNVLKPLQMGSFEGGREKKMPAEATLRREVRSRLFIDFPAPLTLSEKWQLKLATRPGSEIRFVNTSLEVTGTIFERARKAMREFARKARSKLQIKARVEPLKPPVEAEEKKPPPAPALPEARFEAKGGGQELPSSHQGLRTTILGIERLSNQRLRFVVAFANVSSAPIEVPLRLDATKLADDLGNRFRLLASTFGEMGEGGPQRINITVAPGDARELSFEFSGRVQSTELFWFVLGSAQPEQVRFTPIQTRLPPE
jgi:hypothetical protein